MNRLCCYRLAGLLLLAVVPSVQVAAENAIRFFALGDLPYSGLQAERLRVLLRQASEQAPPFLVHVGDVKSGNEPCTEKALGRTAELFRSQPIPVVFTPGDNEWTDCRRESAGGYDPAERLALLRRLYYGDPDVLRLKELGAEGEDPAFPENFWFIYKGVYFASVHVVGSRNNLVPGDAAAAKEVAARSATNRTHLRAAVQAANRAGASAFVLLFHANPGLEKPRSARGFRPFREDLSSLLREFPGPVLAIHGDSHNYQLNQPLLDPQTGEVLRRFTRLEVPGSPTVAGVWVRISLDPAAERPFTAELVYPEQSPVTE